MADATVPVDLLNPGQVFACIGLAEAADVLLGGAFGVFDWSDPGDVLFRLRANGDGSPVERVLGFLDEAAAFAVAPEMGQSLGAWLESWGPSPKQLDRSLGYPYPDPSSPATLVCVLSDGTHEFTLDHWGDWTERDNVKFWAGARGYPGSALARDALGLVRGKARAASRDPFALSAPQSSSFRLDWRRDYIPIDLGFSLNEHNDKIATVGFPIVELMAALGLSNARPNRPGWRNKLDYRYAVVGRSRSDDAAWLPLTVLRAALGGAPFPFPMRHFRMLLDWPGKEGQSRAITTVTEEPVT